MARLRGGVASPRTITLFTDLNEYVATVGREPSVEVRRRPPFFSAEGDRIASMIPFAWSARFILRAIPWWLLCCFVVTDAYNLWARFFQHGPDPGSSPLGIAKDVVGLLLIVVLPFTMRNAFRARGNHGAEHMVSHALEAGAPMTPEAIGSFPRFHPFCGTSAVVVMVPVLVVCAVLTGSFLLSLVVATEVSSRVPAVDNRFLRFLQSVTTGRPSEDALRAAALLGETIRREEP